MIQIAPPTAEVKRKYTQGERNKFKKEQRRLKKRQEEQERLRKEEEREKEEKERVKDFLTPVLLRLAKYSRASAKIAKVIETENAKLIQTVKDIPSYDLCMHDVVVPLLDDLRSKGLIDAEEYEVNRIVLSEIVAAVYGLRPPIKVDVPSA